MKRILHIGMGSPEFDRSAIELGHQCERITWPEMVKRRPGPMEIQRLQKLILERVKEFEPHLVFMQIQNPGIVTNPTRDAMRKAGAYVVEWCGDVRHPMPKWYVDAAPHNDVTCFSNMTDVEIMWEKGLRSEYLQIGYDQNIYQLPQMAIPRKGVVFLGNHYAGFPESANRAEMVRRMKKQFGPLFTVRGRGFNTPTTPGEEVGLYHRSLIALNWDHFHRPHFASDRILRAQACGAMMVSQHYEGIQQEHPYASFAQDIDMMVETCKHWLNNPKEATERGLMAAEHTLENHTWHSRIEQMLEWIPGAAA